MTEEKFTEKERGNQMKTNDEIIEEVIWRLWIKLPTCKGVKHLGVWKKDIGIDDIKKLKRNLKRNLSTSKLLKDIQKRKNDRRKT